MKKFVSIALSVILSLLIGALAIGIGCAGFVIHDNMKNTQERLEDLYQQNLSLLNVIQAESEVSLMRDKMTIDFVVDINKRPSYEYLTSVTVRILTSNKTEMALGTGVIIKITDDYTYILTNKHVAPLEGNSETYIENDEQNIKAEVLKNSAFCDLSLIRIVGKIKGKKVINGLNSILPSDKVYSVGMYLGNYYTYTEGTFAGRQRENIIVNAPTAFGCSGSGVFDRNGDLVGLIYAINQLDYFTFDSAKAVCVSVTSIELFLKGVVEWK